MGLIGSRNKRNRKVRERKREESKTGKANTVLRSGFPAATKKEAFVPSQAMALGVLFAL